MKTGNHQFSQVPSAEIERSSFNRSNNYKTTMNAGDLVPIFVDEVIPGDTFNLRANHFARLATPLKPFMDNVYLDTFYFFVPSRLVWDNFVKFMGEQTNPGDSTDFVVPYVANPMGGWPVGSLGDYFGIPINYGLGGVNALPFRAYNLIWNTWFRDENLQNSVTVHTGDGIPSDPASDYSVLKRGKRHDYFTSCLPWPQKGSAVSISIGDLAPVIYDGVQAGNPTAIMRDANSGSGIARGNLRTGSSPAGALFGDNGVGVDVAGLTLDPNGTLFADLSAAAPITINALREAFQMQKLLERDARGGTRYTEVVRSHFGVISPDARLQRPEYLGGGSSVVNVNPVANTAGGTDPQGNLAAYATSSGRSGFVKSFTEHGYIIGLASVRADLNYQQGLNKLWTRNTRYDFYWPALSHIGEQAVLGQEIYCVADGHNEDVFGYQERYAEYRYKPNLITGLFRSNAAGTLDVWHLAQNFGSRPTLSSTFIQENPPISRVIAVPSEPHFLLDVYFQLTCARPMPVFGVPGLIDHF